MSALASFLHHLAASCADDGFVRLSLSSPTRHDDAVQRIQARLVDLDGGLHLSFTLKEERRDTTQNVPLPDAVAWVERKLGREFRGALLATTTADWQLQLPDGKDARLIRHKPATTETPPRSHDGKKPTFLGASALPWLQGLGIVDQQGRPRKNLADKRVQIDRYVEILAHLARDCGFDAKSEAPLRVVDVGCGKGHLTFAAWHLCKHVLHRTPHVVGIEVRDELVANASELAAQLAPGELTFVHGDIGTVPLGAVDALVALHACNTATDHAIRRGIEAGARLIVVAPCCHQEVRPQLGRPAPLDAVLRHGLFAERMAEWATDGLRTLVLEHMGYRTKAIEFVGGEHTGKNLMLAAVRGSEPTPAQRATTRAAIDGFRAFFGIGTHALDELLAAPGPNAAGA
ncbi:MAG: SAM-dependent methyltransferase [Planctomycetes bacterium]|nr:SAM-dependent methyltransferase [Planctomycetota bacterium]